MEDSNARTVELLRANLMSERSVSRTARQKADELAKRVEELEEQLKIVSLQRKKAEKATADVLVILENQGVSDSSEAYDSDSDQDTPRSEIDSSSVSGRILSWKGRKDSPFSFERCKDSSMRRQSMYALAGSPKQHGRQIRHREQRSTGEKSKSAYMTFDAWSNGDTLLSESYLNWSSGGTHNRLPKDNTSASLEKKISETMMPMHTEGAEIWKKHRNIKQNSLGDVKKGKRLKESG